MEQELLEPQVVWAKVSGYPWWPGYLIEPINDISATVVFFDDFSYSKLPIEKVKSFDSLRERFDKKNKKLVNAFRMAERVFLNRTTFEEEQAKSNVLKYNQSLDQSIKTKVVVNKNETRNGQNNQEPFVKDPPIKLETKSQRLISRKYSIQSSKSTKESSLIDQNNKEPFLAKVTMVIENPANSKNTVKKIKQCIGSIVLQNKRNSIHNDDNFSKINSDKRTFIENDYEPLKDTELKSGMSGNNIDSCQRNEMEEKYHPNIENQPVSYKIIQMLSCVIKSINENKISLNELSNKLVKILGKINKLTKSQFELLSELNVHQYFVDIYSSVLNSNFDKKYISYCLPMIENLVNTFKEKIVSHFQVIESSNSVYQRIEMFVQKFKDCSFLEINNFCNLTMRQFDKIEEDKKEEVQELISKTEQTLSIFKTEKVNLFNVNEMISFKVCRKFAKLFYKKRPSSIFSKKNCEDLAVQLHQLLVETSLELQTYKKMAIRAYHLLNRESNESLREMYKAYVDESPDLLYLQLISLTNKIK